MRSQIEALIAEVPKEALPDKWIIISFKIWSSWLKEAAPVASSLREGA